MLRVLVLVDHARGISGPHRHVVGSLNALARRDDVQLTLLCRAIDDREPYAHSNRIQIRLGYDPHSFRYSFGNACRVLRAARNCHVIYVPTGLKSLLYAQVARHGKRLVAGPNVTPIPNWKQDSPSQIELRLLSDRWIEASEARRAHVFRCTRDASVRVVHHAIDTVKWSPERRAPRIWDRFAVPHDGLKVLFVSRDDEPLKGLVQLLDAFELVRQRTKDPIHLVLIGDRSAATKARLSRMTRTHDLGFLGPDLLPEIYASADISVVPSCWENFPFSVMESLASAVPTIAAKIGGIPEQILNGESGRLVELTDDRGRYRPDTAERLADSIVQLANSPDLRAQLGAAGRRRVLEHFSEDRLARDLVEVFRSSLAQ